MGKDMPYLKGTLLVTADCVKGVRALYCKPMELTPNASTFVGSTMMQIKKDAAAMKERPFDIVGYIIIFQDDADCS